MAKSKVIEALRADPTEETMGWFNVAADVPDLRDRYYEPAMIPLRASIAPSQQPIILDQGNSKRCTGYALAAAINFLRQQHYETIKAESAPEGEPAPLARAIEQFLTRGASARMLYEMASLHDEWEGSGVGGSSVRGALKGFYHNGVCMADPKVDDLPDKEWTLSVERAKQARSLSLGSYFRLRPSILDYHAALNQTGVILVSAWIHEGWSKTDQQGRIRGTPSPKYMHAFVIVGYDEEGFLVQNSWGPDWGNHRGTPGVAHWSYEDWAASIRDGWVMRLAVSTPSAFEIAYSKMQLHYDQAGAGPGSWSPRRQDVIGHIVHLEGGRLVQSGRLATPMSSVEDTARHLAREGRKPATDRHYQHLLFFAHGSLTGEEVGARRIAAMRGVFLRNGIYPINFLWQTDVAELIQDVLGTIADRAYRRIGGTDNDALDWTIENSARVIGRKIWTSIKSDASAAFKFGGPDAEGLTAVAKLLDATGEAEPPFGVHFVGYSGGSILLAECLQALRLYRPGKTIAQTLFLMAPACTVEFYRKKIRSLLQDKVIARIVQYSLTEQRENADVTVTHYNKSMLRLISNAFEAERREPLLGLAQDFTPDPADAHQVILSGLPETKPMTDAKSHAGFATDVPTLNHILSTILGDRFDSTNGFREADLKGA